VRISAHLGAYLKLLGAVVIWGASFVATKIVLRELPPLMMVWTRFLLGTIFLGIVVAARRQLSLPSLPTFLYLGLIGFVGITFHQWLQSTALQTTEASTSSWIVATSPVFMALLGWLVLRERMDIGMMAGIVLAAIGVALVVSKGDWSQFFGGHFGSRGDLLMLISAANWAVFSALSKRGLRDHAPTQMMFLVMVWGWALTSLLLLLTRSWHSLEMLSLSSWIGLLFLGFFCSGVAYLFWYDGLQAVPVVQVGAFLYIEPLVTLVVAVVLLQEKVNWASLVGGGLILFGVWLVNRPVSEQPDITPKEALHTPAQSSLD
jgi:drug/metabolite transporter (DMT)-like permease